MKINILGVKIDKISQTEAVELITGWIAEPKAKKRYVVTPNIEFIIDAQNNDNFKNILNQADLAIPDSSRLASLLSLEREKSPFKKILIAFSLPFSSRLTDPDFPITTGVDLMTGLCEKLAENKSKIALLGATEEVVKATEQALLKKQPKLKIVYAASGGQISKQGDWSNPEPVPRSDITFVALGHIKQENWITKHLDSVDSTVFIGVGGAFDYISGKVPRAPKLLRLLGLEWLFRLILQPWRLPRQLKILYFLLKLTFR